METTDNGIKMETIVAEETDIDMVACEETVDNETPPPSLLDLAEITCNSSLPDQVVVSSTIAIHQHGGIRSSMLSGTDVIPAAQYSSTTQEVGVMSPLEEHQGIHVYNEPLSHHGSLMSFHTPKQEDVSPQRQQSTQSPEILHIPEPADNELLDFGTHRTELIQQINTTMQQSTVLRRAPSRNDFLDQSPVDGSPENKPLGAMDVRGYSTTTLSTGLIHQNSGALQQLLPAKGSPVNHQSNTSVSFQQHNAMQAMSDPSEVIISQQVIGSDIPANYSVHTENPVGPASHMSDAQVADAITGLLSNKQFPNLHTDLKTHLMRSNMLKQNTTAIKDALMRGPNQIPSAQRLELTKFTNGAPLDASSKFTTSSENFVCKTTDMIQTQTAISAEVRGSSQPIPKDSGCIGSNGIFESSQMAGVTAAALQLVNKSGNPLVDQPTVQYDGHRMATTKPTMAYDSSKLATGNDNAGLDHNLGPDSAQSVISSFLDEHGPYRNYIEMTRMELPQLTPLVNAKIPASVDPPTSAHSVSDAEYKEINANTPQTYNRNTMYQPPPSHPYNTPANNQASVIVRTPTPRSPITDHTSNKSSPPIETSSEPAKLKRKRGYNKKVSEDKEGTGDISRPPAHLLPPCKVCGIQATGFHYGVNTCEACKGFFRRSIIRKSPYVCANNAVKCTISPGKRKTCPACRYHKCLEAGMSVEGIKIGRYTYAKRTQDILELKQFDQPSDPDNTTNNEMTDFKPAPATDSSSLDTDSLLQDLHSVVRGEDAITQLPQVETQTGFHGTIPQQQHVLHQQNTDMSPPGSDMIQPDMFNMGHGTHDMIPQDQDMLLQEPNMIQRVPQQTHQNMMQRSGVVQHGLDLSGCDVTHQDRDAERFPATPDLMEFINTILHANDMKYPEALKSTTLVEQIQEQIKDQHVKGELTEPANPISMDQFINVLSTTGVQVDNRLQVLQKWVVYINDGLRYVVNFAKEIPGFRELKLSDQMALIKHSVCEVWIIGRHKAFHKDLNYFTMRDGITIDIVKTLGEEFGTTLLKVTRRLRSLQLLAEEIVIFKAMVMFFTDRCEIEDVAAVTAIRERLLNSLLHLLHQRGAATAHTLGTLSWVLTELRMCSEMYQEYTKKISTNGLMDFPPLLSEVLSFTQ